MCTPLYRRLSHVAFRRFDVGLQSDSVGGQAWQLGICFFGLARAVGQSYLLTGVVQVDPEHLTRPLLAPWCLYALLIQGLFLL